MKKYQLKMSIGNDLIVLKDSDEIYELCFTIKNQEWSNMKYLSIWKDGKVLE